MKLLIVLCCVTLLLNGLIFYYKHTEKYESPEYYEPPTWVKRWDSLKSKWTDANNATRDTMVVGIPIETLSSSGVVTTPPYKDERTHGSGITLIGDDNQTGRATYSLAVDSLGNMIDTIPQLPIHWTSDSTQAYFLLEDIQADYFSIGDSTGSVAIRDNKTMKWEIIDCERALEVWYILDSTRNADYDVEYKPKNKKKHN